MTNENEIINELKQRLNDAWVEGRRHEAYGIIVGEVKPRTCEWLARKFWKLSIEDTEDCFDGAISALIERESRKFENVYSYLFTSARHNAEDVLRERKRDGDLYHYRLTGDDDADWHTSDLGRAFIEDVSPERLLVIVEAALEEEVTLRSEQLKQLFAMTLSKLPPRRRRLVELIANHRSDIGNDHLAEMMSASPSALKSLKSRTFSEIRELLPVAADELGIDFIQVLEPPPEVLISRRVLPTAEEAENGA